MQRSQWESARPGPFRELAGWLGVFAALSVMLGVAIARRFESDPQPGDTKRPFAQIACDDCRAPVWSVSFALEGARLAATTVAGDVWISELGSGDRMFLVRGHAEFPPSVVFSADGRALVVGESASVVRLLDMRTGQDFSQLESDGKNNATHVVVSPDGKYLAAGGFGGALTLWEWGSRRRLAVLDTHRGGISAMAFSRDGSTILAGDSAGYVTIWDVATRTKRQTFPAHGPGNGVTALAVAPEGALLATTSFRECAVRLWNARDGTSSGVPLQTVAGVRALTFSPDGAFLAMARGDGTAALWELAEGREVCVVQANSRSLQSLAFSGDGRLLATGGSDGALRLWDVAEALHGPRKQSQ
jgi:WD40 repeat protein